MVIFARMKLDRYELTAGRNLTTFEFLSEGRRGKIVKVVQFRQMNLENLYNLAFGDKNADMGGLDDKVVTDNGDSEKVLATVVSALYAFCRPLSGGVGLCNRKHYCKNETLSNGNQQIF